jgi:hypothetical protein
MRFCSGDRPPAFKSGSFGSANTAYFKRHGLLLAGEKLFERLGRTAAFDDGPA